MKNRKKIVIIVFALVIFFSITFLASFLEKFKNKKVGILIQKNAIVLPSTAEELTTSKEILAWLDNQKDERGMYIENRFCDPKNQCKLTSKNDSVVAFALLARFRYAVASGDESQINKIKEDLTKYKDILSVEKELMNSNYSCYLLNDLYKSDKFMYEEKEIIKDICRSELYFIPNNPFYYELYENGEPTPPSKVGIDTYSLANTIRENYEKKIVSFLQNKYIITDSKENFNKYSYIATDLVARAEITNENKYINSAVYTYGKALDNYLDNYVNTSVDDKLAFGIASLQMYRLNRNEMYLDLAKKVYERENGNYLVNIDTALQYQLFSEELAKVINNISYVSNRKAIYDFVKKHYYHQIVNTGDNTKSGVLFGVAATTIIQDVKNNSLFVSLISQ